jgi:hypothetical protein
MKIRSDATGNIVTTAEDSTDLPDSVTVADNAIPSDFAKFGSFKYLFRDGAFVVKSGWADPVVPVTDTTDHEAIIAERLRERGIRTE